MIGVVFLLSLGSEIANEASIGIWTAVLMSLGTGLATSFTQWFFFRRKNNAQADSSEIGNMQEIINIWRKTVNELKSDLSKKHQEVEEILKEFDAFKKEFEEMSLQATTLRAEMNQKDIMIKAMTQEIKLLREENKKLLRNDN